MYPTHARFILIQLDRGAYKVSEKHYFMKKVLRKLLSENYPIFVEIWGPTRCINKTSGIFVLMSVRFLQCK